MLVTNVNKNPVIKEQIKNEPVKTLKVLNENIATSESKIKSLKNLKIKTEQVLKLLTESKNKSIEKNRKLKESLLTKLNLKVTK
jgi:hypothetical protein